MSGRYLLLVLSCSRFLSTVVARQFSAFGGQPQERFLWGGLLSGERHVLIRQVDYK